ncbi:MAG: LOG family protein [Anaerolineales bacterium]|nr:LOG family protein [Anaerolineales bacterium]
MNITVFGGSQPQPGSPAYAEAYELGKLLAEAGHTVLTGGYIGTMEAVSRGASEAGGHVIGVTCEEIERWRPVRANGWVKEEWRRETLMERLQVLIEACDAAIALPGGPGTLTEIALTWNLMIVHSMPPKPLILVGAGWRSVFDRFFDKFHSYMPINQRELVSFAPDVQSAVQTLERWHV